MQLFNSIIWSPNPTMFVIPGLDHPVRWYGLLFAFGFILSQQVMMWIFKQEGKPPKHVEKLTVYMLLATVLGARLGHCLFYDPSHYLSNPIEILKVWEGGLASHGGAIGIVFALYLFTRKFPYSFFWILDRIVIVVALTGAMIRTGNFFNSEMEGTATGSDLGVVYAGFTEQILTEIDRDVESVDFRKDETVDSKSGKVALAAVVVYKSGVSIDSEKLALINGSVRSNLQQMPEVVQHIDFGRGKLNYRVTEIDGHAAVEIFGVGTNRHAAQIYEATYCILLMLVLFWLWYKKRSVLPAGFNFALFMIVLWAARFVDEFFKMNQVAFEENMSLNMGQWLSVPMSLIGVGLMVWIYMRKNSPRMTD